MRDHLIPYVRLRDFFAISGNRPQREQMVTMRLREEQIGLVVDEVVGGHQTVIKSLGWVYRNAEGLSGSTILGNGEVALIIKHPTFAAYIDFVMSPAGCHNEWSHLIDAVSTNKTDFFREKIHFDFLSRNLLPRMASKLRRSAGRILRVWSAGCSSGEEPYTMAMVLAEDQKHNP